MSDATMLRGLLETEPRIATCGIALFEEALTVQGVEIEPVDWHPPAAGTAEALAAIAADDRTRSANAAALERMLAAHPCVVDIVPARQAVDLDERTLLHAGPPIDWTAASGPLRGAVVGALLYEGVADTPEAADRLVASGEVRLEPCHHRGAVGPMAGVVSASMPMWVLHDDVHGGDARCTLNEGLGKVLRYGAYAPEVLDRLRWMERVLAPVLRNALRRHGPVDVRSMIGQALHMGDEAHNRLRATTSLLLRELVPDLVEADAPAADVAAVARFVNGNDHFALNIVMPFAKACADAGRSIPGSSVVVAMARNGTEFGVQTSGTGERWFTAPAAVPDGLFLGGFTAADANRDIGDSTITETIGLGGFAMAAAPAIVRFVGGDAPDALRRTLEMYEITLAEHDAFQIPALNFRGTPTGIDVTRVVRTGILPSVNTGIAGKEPGLGQVGAGLVTPPLACFVEATRVLGDAALPVDRRG